MVENRKLILNIAGAINLIMFIGVFASLILVLAGNEEFINSMLEGLKESFESLNVTDGLAVLKQLLIVLSVVYFIITVICFVFAFVNSKTFIKFRYFLIIALVLHLFSASFISLVLVALVTFSSPAIENKVETKSETVNTKMNVLAQEIENLKLQKEKGIITSEEYDKYVSELMEIYANKEIDNGNK